MPVRIAFDLDGVLADFDAGCDRIAERLFPARPGGGEARGPADPGAAGRRAGSRTRGRPGSAVSGTAAGSEDADDEPGAGGGLSGGRSAGLSPRRRRRLWKEIRATRDFWLTLAPLDPAVIPRIHERAASGKWDVFFVTQRPATAGDTVQRQSQRWLVEHGFALPSVIPHEGSRGRLAAALEVDFLVDDTLTHCVDVVSESDAAPILVAPDADAPTAFNARRIGVEVRGSAAAALDLIDGAGAGPATALFYRARQAFRR